MYDIPSELVLNVYQTPLYYVSVVKGTMALVLKTLNLIHTKPACPKVSTHN